MNNVSLIGKVVTDMQILYTPNGTANISFTLAVRRDYKNKQTGKYDIDFIKCVAWKQSAELLHQYVSKGNLVGLNGSMQVRKYKNKSGQMVYRTEVIVKELTLLEKRKGATASEEGIQEENEQEEKVPYPYDNNEKGYNPTFPY